MNSLGKLAILVAVIAVAIIAAGIYRFNFTNDDIYLVMEDGRVLPFDEARQEGQTGSEVAGPQASAVMLKLFSLNTPENFVLALPEGSARVPLTHFIQAGETQMAAGDYRDGEVRGSVLLDYIKITPLNFAPDEQDSIVAANAKPRPQVQEMTFIAPFVVTSQGSGSFWYLGMFNLDFQTNKLAHLDSVFIGDRIEVDNIETSLGFDDPYNITVSYRGHSSSQAMSEAPGLNKTLHLMATHEAIEAVAEEK